jgi:low temperature requirement protein LtrA
VDSARIADHLSPPDQPQPADAAPAPTRKVGRRSPFLRARDGGPQETTTVELFFDLIYVFAVTQLSHLVIDSQISLRSVGHAAFLLVVVWWAWIYSTWMVNWFDPTTPAVRLIVAAVGLISLLMSAAIPHAFGSDAVLFACAYVCMQVGRNVAAMLLLDSAQPLRPVFERLVAWSLFSAPLWIAGAFVSGGARLALWGAALALDLIAPLVGYRTPLLGRSLTSEWEVEGSHFADRFQAFVIIALGESIVVTGATASADGLSARVIAALAVAFVVTGALWWLYFGEVAESSQRQIAESNDPGRLARDAYTYLHAPIVTGIIMVAVGDDLLITAPSHVLTGAGVLMMVAGPAVYLGGEGLVRLRMVGRYSRWRVLTILSLAILGIAGSGLPALALAAGVATILVTLAAVEYSPKVVAA